MNVDVLVTKATEIVITYVPSLIGALIVLIIGLYLIKKVTHFLRIALEKGKVDATLKPFLLSLTSAVLKILLVITVLSMLSVELTSFVTIIGATSLAIGFAFQGTLSNLAGGVLLLLLRPFKVGDYIKATGHEGIVEAIHIFTTVLVTLDNRVIIIPNGDLANTSVVNFNVKPTRRVDLNFGVGYNEDVDKVKGVLFDICQEHPKILKDPAPFIKVLEHGDSAVYFVVRAWTETPNYWEVYFDLLENVKKRFDKESITIPYPQVDVHMDR